MNNTLAPHIRTESTARHMLLDVLLISVVLCFFSAFCYGLRPVLVVLSGTLSAMLSEALCCLFRRQSLQVLLDGSAAVTGTVIGLLMSPMVDYWVPMIGAAFAIIVVKAPFGGYGRNVFNPAAAGMAILSYCFPTRLFTYPAAGSAVRLPLDMHIPEGAVITETSLAAQLRVGATPASSRIQLLIGDFAGPIGATAVLVLLACGAYLLFRRSASGCLVLPYLITLCVIAWLFPCAGVGRVYGTLAQLCSGYVLFTGVFLLNDPVTTPRFWLGRIFYGVFTAILVILLQRIGRVEAGSCFAILIMNALTPIIDRWSWHGWRYCIRLFRVRREVIAHE